MNRTLSSLCALSFAFAAVACGGSADPESGSSATTGGTGGGSSTTAGEDPCKLASGFAGDELCILPPDPADGIQLHVGPKDYTDTEELKAWVINPGDEDVRCFNTPVGPGGFYYFKQENRMRSGSHHMLIPLEPADGLTEGPSSSCDAIGSLGAVPGSQTPKRDFPDQLAPEDEGLARYMPENAMADFQLHYVNNSDEPKLREAWINLYYKPESEVTDRLQGVFLVGDIGVDVPAHSRQTTHLAFEPTLTEKVRLFQINGHSHAHAETFTVWNTHNGVKSQIYKSYDWAEPINLTMNTVVNNPTPDDASRRDGGISGLYYVEPGDKLEWECEVNNTTDNALRFANEAYTAEMCLLAGGYVGTTGGLLAGACFNGSCVAGLGRRN